MKWQLSIVLISILFLNSFLCLQLENQRRKKLKKQNFKFSTTPNDDGNGSIFFLDRHYFECPIGSVLSAFHLNRKDGNKIFYEYNCRDGLAISRKSFIQKQTQFNDTDQENSSVNFLDRHEIKCDDNFALVGFGLIRDGRKIAYKYRCAKIKVFKLSNSCSDKTTPLNQAGTRQNYYLDRHTVDTYQGQFIQGFKLNSNYSNLTNGNQANIQYNYRVCKLLNTKKELKKEEENIPKYKNEYDVLIPKKIKDVYDEISKFKSEQDKLNREISEEKAKNKQGGNKITDLTKQINDFNTSINIATKYKDVLEKGRSYLKNKIDKIQKEINKFTSF